MGKPNPRKLERNRRKGREKAKLVRRALQKQPQPYHGARYKTDEYALFVFQIEKAVYMAFVACDRECTDDEVRRSLQSMILRLRRGDGWLPNHDSLVSELLRQFLPKDWSLSADATVGVLRTILASLEVWGTPSPRSRGYLSFLEGFMNKAGVFCRKASESEVEEPPREDDLLSIGRAWCAGEVGAERVFKALAEQLIADGQPEKVAETCQQLIGEGTSTAVFRELSQLAITAQQHLALPTPQPPPARKLVC